MTPHALLFTLAAIGISETVYLVRIRLEHKKPSCPAGFKCSLVLESRYNRIFGIHNDILGVLFYFIMAFLMALLVIEVGFSNYLHLLTNGLIAFAFVLSSIFVFLQWRVIKAWCFWCIMSAVTISLMGAVVLVSDAFI